MVDQYNTCESLLAERAEMEAKRDEALVLRESVPALDEVAELERILARQQAYRDSLGFFKGKERRRMDERIHEIRAELEDKKILVELQQEVYERQILEMELGIQALTTALERLELEGSESFTY